MKKYLLSLLLIVFIIPSIAFASWWNPFSWNWKALFNSSPQNQTQNSNVATDTQNVTPVTIAPVVKAPQTQNFTKKMPTTAPASTSVSPAVVPKNVSVNYLPAYLRFLNSQKDYFTKQRSILDPLIADAQSKSDSYDEQASYFSGVMGQGLAGQIYQSISNQSKATSQVYVALISSLKTVQSFDDDAINIINTEESNNAGLFLSLDEYNTKYNSSETSLSYRYNLIVSDISKEGDAYFAQDKKMRDNEAQLLGQLQSLATAPNPVYLQPPTPRITICNFSGNTFICN